VHLRSPRRSLTTARTLAQGDRRFPPFSSDADVCYKEASRRRCPPMKAGVVALEAIWVTVSVCVSDGGRYPAVRGRM
jgi:hypothetical protein